MENGKKEQAKDVGQDNQQEEKKSPAKKIISIFIGLDIILVIIIILLLCLKNCSGPSQESTSEDSIDRVRVNKITDIFKNIAKQNMDYMSITDNNVDKVIAVTYTDNYPNTFNLNISVTTETNLYYLTITDYTYDGNKEEYSNFIDYLLLDTTEYKVSHGNSGINKTTLVDTKITTSQSVNSYVISETDSEPRDKYINGFYQASNEFFVYQNVIVEDGIDPFTKPSSQVIKNDSPLYDYYRGLLIA